MQTSLIDKRWPDEKSCGAEEKVVREEEGDIKRDTSTLVRTNRREAIIGNTIVKKKYSNQLKLHIAQVSNKKACSVEFSSVAQLCPTLCDPMNCSMPGLPVHHKLLEFTQTHVHQAGDAIQPSHPLSFPFPPVPNPSQHQGLFQWVNSSHEVAKVLEFQLQHQSLQWTPRTDLL